VETGEVEGRMVELGHQEIKAVDTTADSIAVTEAEVATTEAIVSCPTADEVAAREVAAFDVSSGSASREDTCEVAEKAVKEASAGMRALEPSETAARASSGPGMETGVTGGPLLFGATSGSKKVSQGAHAAWTMEIERCEASPPPKDTAQGASGGKNLAASVGSGASSQSSASQLQREWADTASTAGSGGSLKDHGNNLTLVELSKQLSTVRTSLGNVSL
jgi:hypothetical protein